MLMRPHCHACAVVRALAARMLLSASHGPEQMGGPPRSNRSVDTQNWVAYGSGVLQLMTGKLQVRPEQGSARVVRCGHPQMLGMWLCGSTCLNHHQLHNSPW